MKKWIITLTIILLFISGGVLLQQILSPENLFPAQTWTLKIVPHPQEIRLHNEKEKFIFNDDNAIIYCDCHEILTYAMETLKRGLVKHGIGLPDVMTCNVQKKVTGQIFLTTPNCTNRNLNNLLASANVSVTDTYPGTEGYILNVTPKYILVAGQDSSGTFYGVQSLLQLVEQQAAAENTRLASMTIIDYPDMALRSAFYGFYLNATEDDSVFDRAFDDFDKLAQFKFNMIDLASHHYGHLEMPVPGHSSEKLWQRFSQLFNAARQRNMRPRVGGWAKWVNTNSSWGADLTTLEGIRTTHSLSLWGSNPCSLRITTGQLAVNVVHDFKTSKTWAAEPLVVTDATGTARFQEGIDYIVKYGKVASRDYQKYEDTTQTHLEVLFDKVIAGEGEPTGFPLRYATSFNPPTTIQRLATGNISDGENVRISFTYIGPDPWSVLKVRYCRSDQRLHTDGPDNYLWRWCTDPVRFLDADDFSLDVDETRVFAWDQRCLNSGKSRSRIWADDIQYYYRTIRAVNPQARISMWSDMLDPAHFARQYHTENIAALLIASGMTDLIMIPWKSSIAEESVEFFANNNYAVMPSCQNVTEDGISSAPQWAALLHKYYSKKNLDYGLMFCRWGYGFDSQHTWEQAATVADHAWSSAPYILHNPVRTAKPKENINLFVNIEGDKFVFDGNQVRPGPLPVIDASVYYRFNETMEFVKTTMTGEHGELTAALPARFSGSIEYYISVSTSFNTSYSPDLTLRPPYKITILSSPGDRRADLYNKKDSFQANSNEPNPNKNWVLGFDSLGFGILRLCRLMNYSAQRG